NADKIVLDVKVGEGALMKNIEQATLLARTMVQIGKSFGKETVALLTNMNCPLGTSIGNGLEVREAIETLKGNGDENFKELCITIASYMVSIGKGIKVETARSEVVNNLNNGKAYEKFLEMVAAQQGEINNIDISNKTVEYRALKSGYLNSIRAFELGKYIMKMGAGRETKEDIIDYGVGIILNHNCGDYVNKGESLATLYVRNEDIDTKLLDDIFIIEKNSKKLEPLIYDIIK
ncbi:MAG: pyrimidine-nucleoside phosphorylase, partial [Bacilli bacterium]|nr:pyrimidine-nucleoside phosphorylase [Bacilli bacterium]